MAKAAPTTERPAGCGSGAARQRGTESGAEEDAAENSKLAATGRSRRTRLLRDRSRADPAASARSGAERLAVMVRFGRSRGCRGIERLFGSAAAFPERRKSRGIACLLV